MTTSQLRKELGVSAMFVHRHSRPKESSAA
jgi:hypothetical protein